MACGVHLGILLICLLQAEHVRCLLATQEHNSKTQNSDRYVGFLQQDGSLRRLGGSYPQDQFRQDSISPAQSSSFYSKTAVSRGYNNQRLSQPAQGGYAPATLVQSSSDVKPNWRTTKSKQVNAQKPSFSLSTAIASGSSVSKYNKRQAGPSEGRRKTWPAQHGTQRTGLYQPSSPASVQSPSRERGYYSSSSHQSVAQRPHSAAAKTPAWSVQRGYSPPAKTSSLVSAGALPPQQMPVKMQTSASAPARRVISQKHAKASLPTRFTATQPERAGYQPTAGSPYQNRLFTATGGNAQSGYKPTSNHVSYTHSVPAPSEQNAPVSQRLNSKPSYTSIKQIPSRASAVQALGRSMKPAQGARNLPAGTSSQRFAPTKTYNIPQRFGGFAIRRLKDPEEEAGVQKPQGYMVSPPPTYRPQAPQQAASYRPQAPQQAAPYKPQAPQQAAPYKPQAPQPVASYRPQAPQQAAPHKPQAPQQAAPHKPQAAPYKPQAPSVHRPSTWKRIKPGHSQVRQVQ